MATDVQAACQRLVACMSSGDNSGHEGSICHLSLTSSARIPVPTIQTHHIHKYYVTATITALSLRMLCCCCKFLNHFVLLLESILNI